MAEYVISERLYNLVSIIARSRRNILPSDFAVGNVSEKTYTVAIEILESKCDIVSTNDGSWGEDYELEKDLVEKFIDLSERFLKIEEMSDNITKMQELEKVCPDLIEVYSFIFKLRDLKLAKGMYLEDLKYYKTPEEISEWSNRFDKAYEERNIDIMKSILEEVRQSNKEEWIKYVNDSNGDDFAFIGHSVCGNTEDLRGKHRSKYISTSYFNSEFNTTFQFRYGYIMPASQIMSARPYDTYTDNTALDEEDALRGTSVPVVSHPLNVINTMRKHREENENSKDESKINAKVYSELVFDKFEPIGIFCFTNGLKGLDPDYELAEKLHENSPGLPYKVIDALKYKKGHELINMKLDMINTLKREYEKKLNVDPYHFYNYKEKDLSSFDLFFSDLEKLKQKDDYTADDVMNIYEKNRNLLVTSQYELFEFSLQNYTNEEMKYVFDKGYYFNIESILNGTAGIVTVNNLSKLASLRNNEKFKDIANKYYPGLLEFSQLVNKMPLTEEMYNELKKNPISFTSMNRYLYSLVKAKLDAETNLIKTKLDSKKIKLEEFLNKKEILEQEAEKYKKYREIESSEFMLGIIERNLDESNKELDKLNKEKDYYQNEKDQMSEEYSKLSEKDKIAKELEEELILLSRHPLINRRKISEIKKKLFEIPGEEKANNIQNLRVDMNKLELDISILDIELTDVENRIQMTNDFTKGYYDRLNSDFGTTDISEAKQLVSEAKKFIEQYDSYGYSVLELNIKSLEVEIAELQSQLELLEKEQTINTI